uniref:C2H2-type domain-containing protein n=1 Tax=Timema shepardi TaxID=629360 RepID=A0A7R9G247_TIMSH|nr:unnamed protein product [Timema shepardi]
MVIVHPYLFFDWLNASLRNYINGRDGQCSSPPDKLVRQFQHTINEPDCYATQLLLENTNESIVHTILKPEKTSNVPSTAVCEENIIKDELCFDESSIDVKENTIINLSQNITNVLQINDNQLKCKTLLKIDPNLGHSGVKKYQCDYCCTNTLKVILPLYIVDKKDLINVVFVDSVLPRSNLKFIFLTVVIDLTNVTFVASVLLQRIILKLIFVLMVDKMDRDLTNVIFVAGVSIRRNILKVTSLLIVVRNPTNVMLVESVSPGRDLSQLICFLIVVSRDLTNKNVVNEGKGSLLKDTSFENIDPNLFPIDAKKYNCEDYNKLFSKTINLKGHIVTDRGLRPHQCDVCGKCFKKKSVLNYHVLTHGGQRLVCDVCGKCFKRKDYLKSHILTHSGQKPHKCDVCGKSFHRKDYLKFHFSNHNQKRTHKCEVCGKCFTSSHSLKGHCLTHSVQKPYKCDICDEGFTKKSHLKIHLRIHNKSRPFNCGVCGKSFYRNDHLKSHLLTHSEHSPLKCDVCGNIIQRFHPFIVSPSHNEDKG